MTLLHCGWNDENQVCGEVRKCWLSVVSVSHNGLTLSQMTNSRHVQTERICRRQF